MEIRGKKSLIVSVKIPGQNIMHFIYSKEQKDFSCSAKIIW